jgi:hypothetical protein
VYVKKPAAASIEASTTSGQKESHSYTSDSYQKILDYHVVEILMTTVLFGVIVLFRMHH